MRGEGLEAGPGGDGLVVDRLAIGEDDAGGAAQGVPDHGALLVEDSDGADESGPGVGVERSPAVGPLAGVVAPLVHVEGLGLIRGEGDLPLVELRREIRIVRFGLGVKQVGVQSVHLVSIDEKILVRVVTVSFEPGARTHWHTHPAGQVLHVVKGAGWVQTWVDKENGKKAESIRPDDVVYIPPDEKHWHGAKADTKISEIPHSHKIQTSGQ